MTGDFGSINFVMTYYNSNNHKIKSIEQWGTNEWKSMTSAYKGCSNLVINSVDVPDLSGVTNLNNTFSECTSLGTTGNLNNWDISNITSLYYTFYKATSFNQPLNNWDTSNITNMSSVFNQAIAFNQPLNDWNTSNVVYMNSLFYKASSFNQPLDNWNVSNVMSFSETFVFASSFNQDLSLWSFNPNVTFGTFISNSGIDVANYDAFLAGLLYQTEITQKILWAMELKYCDTDVHYHLTDILGWSILGDSISVECNANTIEQESVKFLVFPNPVSRNLFIEGDSIKKIEIYDLRSQVKLYEYNTNLVDVSNLPQGMYILKIIDDKGFVQNSKILKK